MEVEPLPDPHEPPALDQELGHGLGRGAPRARASRTPRPGSAAPPRPPGTRPRSDPTPPAGPASGGRRARLRRTLSLSTTRTPAAAKRSRSARKTRSSRPPSLVRSSSFDIPGLSGSRAWKAASAASASRRTRSAVSDVDVPLPVDDEDALARHQVLEVRRAAPRGRTAVRARSSAVRTPPAAHALDVRLENRRRRARLESPEAPGEGRASPRLGRGDVEELPAADRHHGGIAPDDVAVPGQRHDRRLEPQLDVAALPRLDGGPRHRVHARHDLARPDVDSARAAASGAGPGRLAGARTSRRACTWAGGGPAARARRRARSPRARCPGGSRPRAGRPRPSHGLPVGLDAAHLGLEPVGIHLDPLVQGELRRPPPCRSPPCRTPGS